MTVRLIIAGSRSITSYETVVSAIDASPYDIDKIGGVISGCASGVDTLGEKWAEKHGISVDKYPASDYDDEGKPATLVRNDAMVADADALLAVWDGESNGTEYTINAAQQEGICVDIYRTDSFTLDDF